MHVVHVWFIGLKYCYCIHSTRIGIAAATKTSPRILLLFCKEAVTMATATTVPPPHGKSDKRMEKECFWAILQAIFWLAFSLSLLVCDKKNLLLIGASQESARTAVLNGETSSLGSMDQSCQSQWYIFLCVPRLFCKWGCFTVYTMNIYGWTIDRLC